MLLEIIFGAVAVLLVLALALSLRIQRIRLLKFNMQVKHDLSKLEKELDEVKRTLPDLVDREKLAFVKEGLRREISALEGKISQEDRKFVRLSRQIESEGKSEKKVVRTVSKLEKMVERLRKRLAPKRLKKRPVKKK
jgi:chromosome segregation ATPase